ncbi:MAG: glycosyltransferase, partial [Candidatus Nanohaloarchaea archaeon]
MCWVHRAQSCRRWLDVDGVHQAVQKLTNDLQLQNPPEIGLRTEMMNDQHLMDLHGLADCFAFPSRAECVGISWVQAMHAGTPVITTDWSAMNEYISDNEAVLVESGITKHPQSRVQWLPRKGGEWYPDEAEWFEPDVAAVQQALRKVYEMSEEERGARREGAGDGARHLRLGGRHGPAGRTVPGGGPMTRVLALILDAIDMDNLYMWDMPFLQELYEQGGEVLGCSTLPHTALSNPMIWGGVENEDKFWVENIDGEGDQWVDPAQYFDREEGEPVDGARGFSREEDYADETFIWDDLHAAGYDARALQVPIVLPPYSFRVTDVLDDAWFPDVKERMAAHIREKPALIRDQFEDGADFVATSIQMPDKWLHGMGEGKCGAAFVNNEAPV